MKKRLIMIGITSSVLVFSSCMDGGKGKRAATPAIDSIGDTISKSGTVPPETDRFSEEEQVFILAAATGGNMEVEAATLALKRAKDAGIKAFATQMIRDHTKAISDLRSVVSAKGIGMPDSLTSEQLLHLNGLKALNDRAFEKQYMTMMIADHANTVRLFEDGTRLPDTGLKTFAVKTLPVIKEHKAMAVRIGKKLNLKNVNEGDDLQGASPAAGHTN